MVARNGPGKHYWLFRVVRARIRLKPRWHADMGAKEKGAICSEWQKNVDNQRSDRQGGHYLGEMGG